MVTRSPRRASSRAYSPWPPPRSSAEVVGGIPPGTPRPGSAPTVGRTRPVRRAISRYSERAAAPAERRARRGGDRRSPDSSSERPLRDGAGQPRHRARASPGQPRIRHPHRPPRRPRPQGRRGGSVRPVDRAEPTGHHRGRCGKGGQHAGLGSGVIEQDLPPVVDLIRSGEERVLGRDARCGGHGWVGRTLTPVFTPVTKACLLAMVGITPATPPGVMYHWSKVALRTMLNEAG